MKVGLIAASPERLAWLSPVIESVTGLDLTAQVRERSPDWHRQVHVESFNILILDSQVDTLPQERDHDLVLLGQWATRHPALGVLLLSDEIDPAFLLQAMRSGVREVLRSHPEQADLTDALERLKRHVESFKHQTGADTSPPHNRGRLVAFVPTKGGSGATFLATNLAHLLAKECQLDTVLIDLDLHGADASYFLSSDDHRNSLLDLTRHTDRLDAHLMHSSLHPVLPQLFLLAAPELSELSFPITAQQLEPVLQLAREQYGMVLLDMPDALDALTVKALDMADEVYLVMGNTVPHVRNAKRWLTMLRSLGYADTKLRVVLNTTQAGSDIDVAHIESALGLPVCHTLPGEPATALSSVNQGLPLMNLNPHSPLVQALRHFMSQEWQLTTSKRKSWLERWF